MKYTEFLMVKSHSPMDIVRVIRKVLGEAKEREISLDFESPSLIKLPEEKKAEYYLACVLFSEINVDAFIASEQFKKETLSDYAKVLSILGISGVDISPVTISDHMKLILFSGS